MAHFHALKEITGPIHKMLTDSAVGPLPAALKIVKLGEVWERQYQDAASGASFDAFLV